MNTTEEKFEIIGGDALSQLERASIDMQISTAKRYPRDFAKVKREMLNLATLDEETAASCFYKLNRQGKSIEGPSVRMAEIAVSCFGNIRAASRVISNDGKTITAQGICHDLQNNTLISVEVKRRITDKQGNTYSEDMQVVTGNAACAIAFRNAVHKVVPMALIKPVYERAKATAIGDIKTLTERRTGALKYFASLGVMDSQVLAYLGVGSVENINLDELENLIGLTTAIKEGSTTVDEAFGPKPLPKVAAPPGATPAPDPKKEPMNQQQAQQKPPEHQEVNAKSAQVEPSPEEQRTATTEPEHQPANDQPQEIPSDPAQLLALAQGKIMAADIDATDAIRCLVKLKKTGAATKKLADVPVSGLTYLVKYISEVVAYVNANPE